MSTHHTTTGPSTPSRSVLAWRRRCLLAAGFEPALADVLAADAGIDLHAVLELTDRGCPPGLAARILAPLESRWPR